jgi:hypothetical protein
MDLSILIATVPPRKKYLNRLLTNLQDQIVKNELQNRIEVVIYQDNFESVVGYKFNKLVESAKGRYCVLIGDDDMVSEDYCSSIIKAIDENPNVDQISHNHRYYHNNKDNFIRIKVSNKYEGESLVFFNFLKCYVQKYYDDRNQDWEFRLNVHQFIKTFEDKEKTILKLKNNSIKMLFFLFIIKFLKKKITLNLRHTCHTTPIKKEIFESVKFSDRPREQDLEWATKIYKMGLIKTECVINKDLYYYYYNENMSINRGKGKDMSEEEQRDKLTETFNKTVDINWSVNTIDKINLRWI